MFKKWVTEIVLKIIDDKKEDIVNDLLRYRYTDEGSFLLRSYEEKSYIQKLRYIIRNYTVLEEKVDLLYDYLKVEKQVLPRKTTLKKRGK